MKLKKITNKICICDFPLITTGYYKDEDNLELETDMLEIKYETDNEKFTTYAPYDITNSKFVFRNFFIIPNKLYNRRVNVQEIMTYLKKCVETNIVELYENRDTKFHIYNKYDMPTNMKNVWGLYKAYKLNK